ncbi:DNA repair protein RecO [Succinivibrio dextrinosolvens]|uniref:DNA repair protein RecO n=1 Tax=Succinivibrio dextrinosolvens TaxID=83771 RepID=UPI00241E56F4|nr:DNA repair protein RecO [Succinivibrio dextrinosolvens]MBE6423971.1 DNA repair protein RecO [Succinivibrio dextrinosolvens]
MPLIADSEAGFIIHSRPFKEKSLLLDLYTLNYGRISAVARVSKTSASRSMGVYQPFVPLKLYLRQGKSSLWQLSEALIQRQSFNISTPKIFSAIYLNELLYYLTIPQDPDPHLFATYLDALGRLENGEDEFMILRNFEEILIESLGYAPNYETIAGENFKPDSFYIYLPKNGFIESEDMDNLLFSGKDLISIKNRDYSERNTRIALKNLYKVIVDSLLNGKSLKSRALYSQFLMVK